jgi:hypothetical protein
MTKSKTRNQKLKKIPITGFKHTKNCSKCNTPIVFFNSYPKLSDSYPFNLICSLCMTEEQKKFPANPYV